MRRVFGGNVSHTGPGALSRLAKPSSQHVNIPIRLLSATSTTSTTSTNSSNSPISSSNYYYYHQKPDFLNDQAGVMSGSGRGSGQGQQSTPPEPFKLDAATSTMLQRVLSQLPATQNRDPGHEADPPSSPPYSPPPATIALPSPSPTTLATNANNGTSSANRADRTNGTNGSEPKGKRKAKPKRDAIVPPSAASGGIPEPTQQYLAYASMPPFLLPSARIILVVIDLNGTLLHRPSSRNAPSTFVERPHARVFLRYCIRTFKVVIWSSARRHNVEKMCRQLLTPEELAQVVAVWGRDRFGLTKEDYNQRVQCYKRLSKLWEDETIALSHPEAALGKRWSQLDTVLVDDSVEKARSEPYNIIALPEFTGDKQEKGHILPQVHDYINECSRRLDVSAFIRSQPFKVIPDWSPWQAPPQ
ncbi:HAD-like protein [Hypoxylon sp. FL0543]|nr:HAD-like protein [Hypoxylon sp. FL0543]